MTEVHRYKVVQMVSEAGGCIGYDPHGPEVVMASAYDQLKAEIEALRKDAERYQWLRQGMGKVIVVEPDNATSCDCDRYEVLLEAEVDDAVDAEIAKEASHD